jgi:hypothetical protein
VAAGVIGDRLDVDVDRGFAHGCLLDCFCSGLCLCPLNYKRVGGGGFSHWLEDCREDLEPKVVNGVEAG